MEQHSGEVETERVARAVGSEAPKSGPRAAKTRERILEAGVRCVRRWGLHRVLVKDVAQEAGLARRTVYVHFPDREVLVQAVLVRNGRQQLEAVGVHVRQHRTLAAAGRRTRRSGPGDAFDAQSLGLGYWPGEGPEATLRLSRVDEVAEEWVAFWEPLVAAARERGEVRPATDVRAASEWIARVIVSMAVMPLRTEGRDDPAILSRRIGEYVVRGLAC
ncbi:TetR/AcrR family transcriptional regulator [Yinghuangia aomiensis]